MTMPVQGVYAASTRNPQLRIRCPVLQLVYHSIAVSSKEDLQIYLSLLFEGCNINKRQNPAK